MREKRIELWRKNRGIAFILPSLIGVSLFFLLPYLSVLKQSFTSTISSEWLGLANYQNCVGE
jgi:multiple sugar transport system permease protein